MTKFLILWKLDMARVPESPEEQMNLFTRLMDMVGEDFKSGMLDWGEFVNSQAGYAVNEGTEQELALVLMKYSPYLRFKVQPVLSADQVRENMKTMS